MEGSFNFLGDILLKEQLFDFPSLIRDNFPGTVSQNTKLSEKLEALSKRANTWPSEILRVYHERQAPLYNSKDIIKLKTQNSSEIQIVNSTRTKIEKTFQLDTRFANYLEELVKIYSKLNMYNDHPNLIPNIGHDDHPLRLQYTRASLTSSIQSGTTRVNTIINANLAEIGYLQGEKYSITFLKVSSHYRHWILKNENHLTGFHPLTGRNEKIVNNALPSDSDISRLICTHQESKCLNEPLSILA